MTPSKDVSPFVQQQQGFLGWTVVVVMEEETYKKDGGNNGPAKK
jgi:hypothetical protein